MLHNGLELDDEMPIPDMDQLIKSGVEFINQRIAYGATRFDKNYAMNYDTAKSKNLGVIGYLYTLLNNLDGEIKAVNTVTSTRKPDILEIDWEIHTASLSADVIYLQALSQQLIQNGYMHQMLYANPGQGQLYYASGIEKLLYLPLHVANYDVGYPGQVWPWIGWAIWQHTQRGRLWGINANCALEVTHYDWPGLLKLTNMNPFNGKQLTYLPEISRQ